MNNEIKEIFNKYGKSHYEDDYCLEFETYIVELKELKALYDYITDLQEENAKLKQPQIFIDTMDMEERYGQELYQDYLKEQLEDYKQRNEKAIEIYEKRTTCEYKKKRFMEDKNTSDLMYDILKGGNK